MNQAARQTLSTALLAGEMAIAIHRHRVKRELVFDGHVLGKRGSIKEARLATRRRYVMLSDSTFCSAVALEIRRWFRSGPLPVCNNLGRLELAFATILVSNELHSVTPVDEVLAEVVQEDHLINQRPRQGLLTFVAVLEAIDQILFPLDLHPILFSPP